jgi:2-polyprenyl-3-methyl-5-hydroxy-6-metoxy-1,4-benzoquinol methylase/glycosyltransferase involved in cell wall biosynthesis
MPKHASGKILKTPQVGRPECPICGRQETVFLCTVGGHDIWRCPRSAVDFVFPMPSLSVLQKLHARPACFEGGQQEADVSFDARTGACPAWLDELISRLTAERTNPSILDIGCRDGLRLSAARAQGWQAFGVEPSLHARSEARARDAALYVVETVEEIPPHRFDVILILHVIEHLSAPYELLYGLVLKNAIGPETIVAITTPNACTHDALKDAANWLYRQPPSNVVFYSATALNELLRSMNFTSVEIRGQDCMGTTLKDTLPLDETSALNRPWVDFAQLLCIASGSEFAAFIQERYVPGTWSEIAAYEHIPRYRFARTFAAGKRVLDFGCGSGYGAAIVAKDASMVVALDASEGSLKYARRKFELSNLSFILDKELGSSLDDASFDVIICFEVIEHLDAHTQRRLLAALRRLLAPQGRLLISTPNPDATGLYGANRFHIHELTLSQFQCQLSEQFAYVEIIQQCIYAGIFLQPTNQKNILEVHNLPEFSGRNQPAAFMAICSLDAIEPIVGVVYPDFSRHYIASRIKALRCRDAQLIDRYNMGQLKASIDAERSEAAAKTRAAASEVMDARNRLSHIEQELISTRHHLGQVKSDYALTIDRLAGLEREYALTTERLREVERKNALAKNALAEVEREYASARAGLCRQLNEVERENASIKRKLLEIEREYAASSERLQQVSTHLNEILHSTSWRAIRLFSPLLRVFRPILRPTLRRMYRFLRYAYLTFPGQLIIERATTSRNPSGTSKKLDLLRESCMEPVWCEKNQLFFLRCNEQLLSERLAGGQTAPFATTKPYSARLGTLIDPTVKRSKVLHVIPNVYLGGSTQLIVDLVDHLSVRSEHHILTSALWAGGAHNGLVVHHVASPDVIAMRNLYKQVNPDIIHFHYWGLTDQRWYRAALEGMLDNSARALQNINTPVYPLVHSRFDCYIFVSNYVRDLFGRAVMNRESSHVIYPGIDLAKFAGGTTEDAADAIGMVYRLEGDKLKVDSIDLLIEVVRLRPRTKAYVIGGGSYFRPYLLRTIEAGVRDNFAFTGYVSYESLPQWYEKFSIFVAPVWQESFGQVSPFAMSKGLAVSGYNVGALSEILGGTETLGATLQETAHIIVDLLNDPQRLRRIGERNIARAKSMFDVRLMAARYGEIYDQLLELGRDC